jgi:hypothetical protein
LTVEPGEKVTPANVNEPAVAATEPAWSSRTKPATESSRAQALKLCWEASRIMLLRILEQKTCRTESSNLI